MANHKDRIVYRCWVAVTKEARREMAILGFHSERHRLALALFGGSIGAAAELAVPTPPPQVIPAQALAAVCS